MSGGRPPKARNVKPRRCPEETDDESEWPEWGSTDKEDDLLYGIYGITQDDNAEAAEYIRQILDREEGE